jgi:hypothetical protein
VAAPPQLAVKTARAQVKNAAGNALQRRTVRVISKDVVCAFEASLWEYDPN